MISQCQVLAEAQPLSISIHQDVDSSNGKRSEPLLKCFITNRNSQLMVKKTALAFSEMDHAEQVDPQDVWEVGPQPTVETGQLLGHLNAAAKCADKAPLKGVNHRTSLFQLLPGCAPVPLASSTKCRQGAQLGRSFCGREKRIDPTRTLQNYQPIQY